MADRDTALRIGLAVLAPSLIVAVGGLALLVVSFLFGLMWLSVWGPYVLACWVLAVLAMLIIRGPWRRQVVGLLVAWLAAVPLGALISALVLFGLDQRSRAAGVISGGSEGLEVPGYYWWSASFAAVSFCAGTLASLIGSNNATTTVRDRSEGTAPSSSASSVR